MGLVDPELLERYTILKQLLFGILLVCIICSLAMDLLINGVNRTLFRIRIENGFTQCSEGDTFAKVIFSC
ncbi:hypothetical protein ATPR_3393 [Acetobacter tropicalis NBRC 101654]|uniref:Uncharacterized protein n=1 Tax=Acetobacter tropicalis NBRC 101654 TaxID=749388 RepID=F7VJ44_9PROT|nr:hypothetical protein ATPR_3393 [Acetobacter tropicalis NBRC 101654]